MVIPRPLAALRHGAVIEVIHFDYLHLGGDDGHQVFAAETGHEYLLVLIEDTSGFLWLEPAQSCSAAGTARTLMR